MIRCKTILLLVSFFSICYSASSQETGTGAWLVYFGNNKINTNWILQSDMQFRMNQFPNQKNQLLLRAGLGYNLTENNHNLLLGFAFVSSAMNVDSGSLSPVNEKRIYQQYLFKKNISSVFTTNRIRLEQRFLPNEFGLRARHFVSIQKPINKKNLSKHSIYGSIYNEFFYELTKLKIDRNRLYGGIGFALTDNIRIESGYMIQSQKNITRGQVQLIMHNNISFFKK